MNEEVSSQPTHLVWDADGSPDSVIALLYFLQHPGISVEAVTVSCGQAYPDICASNLVQMLARLGIKGIPVSAGRAVPLEGNNAFPDPWRNDTNGFWGIELPDETEPVQPLPAAELIIRVLNKSPSPITLFVSGTHTNLAEALRLDPNIKNNIASVHVMGGALHVPGNIASEWPEIPNKVAEWNIWVDPIAACEVINAGLSLQLTPLDATNQVIWTSDDANKWRTSSTAEGLLAAEILSWMVVYLRDLYPDGVYLWDLVAAVNATDPDLCQGERVHIQVVTELGDEKGRTVAVSGQLPNTTVCLIPQAEEIKQRIARHILS